VLGGTVRGQQVRLRTTTEADLEAHLRWHADPELTKWMTRRPAPQSLDQRKEWLKETAKERDLIHWEIAQDDQHIGYCDARRRWRADSWAIETFFLAPEARGRGLGGDAGRALHRYLIDHAGLDQAELWLYRDDAGGRRLFEALGYVEYAHGHDAFYRDGRWWDDWRGALAAEEFQRRFPDEIEYPDRQRA